MSTGFMTVEGCDDGGCCDPDPCVGASPPEVIAIRLQNGSVEFEVSDALEAFYEIICSGEVTYTGIIPLNADGTGSGSVLREYSESCFVRVTASNECETTVETVPPCFETCNVSEYFPDDSNPFVRTYPGHTFDGPHCTRGCFIPTFRLCRPLLHTVSGVPAPFDYMNGSYITTGFFSNEAVIFHSKLHCGSFGSGCPIRTCASLSANGREPDGEYTGPFGRPDENLFECEFSPPGFETVIGHLTLDFIASASACSEGQPCSDGIGFGFERVKQIRFAVQALICQVYVPLLTCNDGFNYIQILGGGAVFEPTFIKTSSSSTIAEGCSYLDFDPDVVSYSVQWL